MSNITLMYHDVLNEQCPYSGFQKVGALQYTIESKILDLQLKLTEGMDNIQFTFDDGGESFYYVIAKLLENYNRKGVFFISTSYIGSEFFLSEEQIRELDRRGHIIASHSHTHPNKISSLSREECVNEWKESKLVLENILGHNVNVASVPGGAVSDMVIDCMIEAGFQTIYTSEPTLKIVRKGNATICGRYGIKKETTIARFKKIISNPFHRKMMLMHYYILIGAKQILGSHYNNIKQIVLKIGRS